MLRMSIDDGCASDKRIAGLCDKYGVDAVFYWPAEWHSLAFSKGYSPLTFDAAREIANRYEVGSHTVSHRILTDLPLNDAKREIADSKDLLENLFGGVIKKFAPPRGYTNPELTEFTLEVYDSQRLTKGEGLVHIHPNSGANGNIHWLDYVKDHEITEAWLHTWELNKYPEEWVNLEKYLATLYR